MDTFLRWERLKGSFILYFLTHLYGFFVISIHFYTLCRLINITSMYLKKRTGLSCNIWVPVFRLVWQTRYCVVIYMVVQVIWLEPWTDSTFKVLLLNWQCLELRFSSKSEDIKKKSSNNTTKFELVDLYFVLYLYFEFPP